MVTCRMLFKDYWHRIKVGIDLGYCRPNDYEKESLDSDGQQFLQYQQPLTLNHITHKRLTYADENLGPGFGKAKRCGKLKPVNEITTLPL